MVFFLEKQILW